MPFKKRTKTEDKPIEQKITKQEVPPTKVKAFYIERINSIWHLVICDIQDGQVVNKVTKDAANKALALETFKIEFSKHYFFGR